MDGVQKKKQKPAESSSCPHVNTVGVNTWEDVQRKIQIHAVCTTCRAKGQNLWLCLHSRCLYVGCGASVDDHSTSHSTENEHWLTLNMTTNRIWCYECEEEVLKENNKPPFPMRERSMSLTPLSEPVSPERTTSGTTASVLSPAHSQASSLHDESESEEDDEAQRLRGLTGLQNIGNTCYMNAALQTLSNCPPLRKFFLDCHGYVRTDKKPMLSRSYCKLMNDMWDKKRRGYVVPSSVAHGIKLVHPMFRGYSQQDSQEFLRCFMDQLHEELKAPVVGDISDPEEDDQEEMEEEEEEDDEETEDRETDTLVTHKTTVKVESNSQQSDTDYETCDSGLSSERSSVEHSIASGDECTMMDTDKNSLSSQTDLSTPTGDKGDINSPQNSNKSDDLDRDSAISSSMSSIGTNADKNDGIPGNKSKKEAENIIKRQTHGDETKVSFAGMDTTEYTDANSEMEPLQKGRITKTRTPSTSSKRIRSRQSSENDKSIKIHPAPGPAQGKRKKAPAYRSVISDIFDGKILSSVQCLTCERVSSTKETFQDLSLPIPTKDHLHVIHASQAPPHPKGTCGEVTLNQGWVSWMLSWMRSWFWGPTITLKDCLAAFFSADELKGDNMYSCEKCKKLRNGIKFSKVMELPEILCIHLKRFRHEFMFSTKISSHVSFPLEDLDMGPYLHKECKDQITQYDLVGVICHHGTAGGGHYTSYCLNSDQWYEFDDQCVTEVDMQQVENCEAYVLFYRKKNDRMMTVRENAAEFMEITENTFMKFYVSKQWINKFYTFSEPGPITNHDFLCKHGGVHPNKWPYVTELVWEVSQKMWTFLHEKYGGGPAISHLSQCVTCQQEMDRLKKRQKLEKETFQQLQREFQNEENPGTIYAISMHWFKEWEKFVMAKTDEPPYPIDNSKIALTKGGISSVKMNAEYGELSEEMWQLLYKIYGGGPVLITRQTQPPVTPLAHRVNDSGDSDKSAPEGKV